MQTFQNQVLDRYFSSRNCKVIIERSYLKAGSSTEPINTDMSSYVFVRGTAKPADVIKSECDNSLMTRALRVIATRTDLLLGGPKDTSLESYLLMNKRLSAQCSDGLFPPIFHKYRAKGIYCIKLYQSASPVFVIVDERIPVYRERVPLQPCFSHCAEPSQIWV
jgi:hypothetical protein